VAARSAVTQARHRTDDLLGRSIKTFVIKALLSLPWVIRRAGEVRTPFCF
jgi:hypothetical protein